MTSDASRSVRFQVEPVNWATARQDLLAIREEVFVEEQGVPMELDVDGLDPACVQVLARTEQGQPIGTARMTAGGKIGRMAVIKAWRGRGVGTALLKELLTEARARRLTHVLLDAQVQALPFYEKHGFRAEGEGFFDAGLPHLNMTLRLLT